VLRVVSPEQAEIVYDGPDALVWAKAGKMQKNSQRKIALSKLSGLTPPCTFRQRQPAGARQECGSLETPRCTCVADVSLN
jgi:hypothetical protein